MTAAKKNAPDRKRILVVDDHPMMREGLALLIGHEEDLVVCGEAGTSAEALEKIQALRPDLVIADITLPDKSGLELIKDALALAPALPILVISMHEEGFYAERVLRAGGRGYVMKQEGGKKLMGAMRRVLDGGIYVSEKMSAHILQLFSSGRPETGAPSVESLTDREFEVFQLIGQGMSTAQMASRLHLSRKTVEVHRTNIKAKLGIRSIPELISYAVRWSESGPPS